MADIGRILFLPPPTVPGRANSIQTTPNPATTNPGADQAAPDQAGATDDANAGRAKQFRFRVYDGGRPDEKLAGDNGLPARRAGDAPADESAARPQARVGVEPAGQAGRSSAAITTASAPFLAQLIAQEQMRPGLYDPPLRAADRAYRQAGGEPVLQDGNAVARFQIAV